MLETKVSMNWDVVDHYSLDCIPRSLSVDTLGSLKEDESGYRFIIVMVDNFSKLQCSWSTFGPKHDVQEVRSVPSTMGINFRGFKRDPHL